MIILIVDDSKLNLSVAQDILNNHYLQCTILLAESGEDALNILKTHHVDIVLLDIVMPGISGLEVLKKIKSNDEYKNINVVMLTSLTDMNILKQCFDYGANDFINKPIEPIEFIARIKASMREVNYKISLERAINIVSTQNEKLMLVNKTLQETQFYIVQKEKLVAVGELAAGLAHELNTPLAYVSSNFQVLKKNLNKIKTMTDLYRNFVLLIFDSKIANETVSNSIEEIRNRETSFHLDYIIEDLNELIDESKTGIDKAAKIIEILRSFTGSIDEENFRNNSLNDIIEEVLLITNNEFKDIATIEKFMEPLPMILCSRSNIAQVIINILTNALYAIKANTVLGEGKIVIKTYKESNHIVCSISDNGPGIDTNIINRVFNPFFTTKDVGEGTGLGLSIAYDIIVNKHHGELIVDNLQPSGAIFTIKLPLQ